MKKKLAFALAGLLLLVGLLGGTKFLQINRMIEAGSQFTPPPETVSSADVQVQSWESLLTAVGSTSAVQGVTVAAELPGKIVSIEFTGGEKVAKGDLLVQQDISSEKAQLPGAEAEVALREANRERFRKLLEQKFISQAEFDDAETNFRIARSVAENIRASLQKKTIRAPFAGHLGIRLVNLGQVLKEGDPIVSLQTLDPIFIDFALPQQALAKILPGLPVRATTDAHPGEVMVGKITAINPQVDVATRNVQVQATLENPREILRPGMFVNVEVALPDRRNVTVIPAPAVLYAPYGDSVFLIEKGDQGEGKKGGTDGLVLRQQFVRLGEKRGDFIQVLTGLKEGETIASTGVFKLRNGQAVVIDNTLAPEFKLEPKPENN